MTRISMIAGLTLIATQAAAHPGHAAHSGNDWALVAVVAVAAIVGLTMIRRLVRK